MLEEKRRSRDGKRRREVAGEGERYGEEKEKPVTPLKTSDGNAGLASLLLNVQPAILALQEERTLKANWYVWQIALVV